MKATELAERLLALPSHKLESEVRIVIYQPGSIGGMPSVALKAAGMGIDWNGREFQLIPDAEVTKLTAEEVAAVMTSVRGGGSWHAYKAQEKLRDRIKSLEAELAALKAAP